MATIAPDAGHVISSGYLQTSIDHPIANHGQVLVHRAILYDEIGPGVHPCHWCGELVEWRVAGQDHAPTYPRLIVDHVDNDPLNNVPDNLVPACDPCNIKRGVNRG